MVLFVYSPHATITLLVSLDDAIKQRNYNNVNKLSVSVVQQKATLLAARRITVA